MENKKRKHKFVRVDSQFSFDPFIDPFIDPSIHSSIRHLEDDPSIATLKKKKLTIF